MYNTLNITIQCSCSAVQYIYPLLALWVRMGSALLLSGNWWNILSSYTRTNACFLGRHLGDKWYHMLPMHMVVPTSGRIADTMRKRDNYDHVWQVFVNFGVWAKFSVSLVHMHVFVAAVLELFGLSPCPHPNNVPWLHCNTMHDRFENKVSFAHFFSNCAKKPSSCPRCTSPRPWCSTTFSWNRWNCNIPTTIHYNTHSNPQCSFWFLILGNNYGGGVDNPRATTTAGGDPHLSQWLLRMDWATPK
jgi:hypothetical protein